MASNCIYTLVTLTSIQPEIIFDFQTSARKCLRNNYNGIYFRHYSYKVLIQSVSLHLSLFNFHSGYGISLLYNTSYKLNHLYIPNFPSRAFHLSLNAKQPLLNTPFLFITPELKHSGTLIFPAFITLQCSTQSPLQVIIGVIFQKYKI